MKTLRRLLFSLTVLITSVAVAQLDASCPAIVQAALDNVDDICSDTSRNQVCYGNISLEAQPRADVESFKFENVGDIEDVVAINTLRLQSLNEETNEWGVAVMRLQANLPETLPGQNVTFLLFGDVEITNAVTDEQLENGELTPMQAFYFKTGIGDAACEEAPDSGIMVQTPEGTGEVNIVMNEVNVALGSTILFTAEPGGEMRVSALEGAAALEMQGEVFPVIAGTWVKFRVSEDLSPIERPSLPETYDQDKTSRLPIELLQRRIEIREPLTENELAQVRERILNGEPPCDEQGPFPTCDHLPTRAGGTPCVLPGRESESISPDREPCDFESLRDIGDGNLRDNNRGDETDDEQSTGIRDLPLGDAPDNITVDREVPDIPVTVPDRPVNTDNVDTPQIAQPVDPPSIDSPDTAMRQPVDGSNADSDINSSVNAVVPPRIDTVDDMPSADTDVVETPFIHQPSPTTSMRVPDTDLPSSNDPVPTMPQVTIQPTTVLQTPVIKPPILNPTYTAQPTPTPRPQSQGQNEPTPADNDGQSQPAPDNQPPPEDTPTPQNAPSRP